MVAAVAVVAAAAAVVAAAALAAEGQLLPLIGAFEIPDFSTVPPASRGSGQLVRSVADGAWGSAATWTGGRVPQAQDVVIVEHAVLFDAEPSADVAVVFVNGTLAFERGAAAQPELRVETLQVASGGHLELGACRTCGGGGGSSASGPAGPSTCGPVMGQARVTFLDVPVNTAQDPFQWGSGLLVHGRLTVCGEPELRPFVRTRAEPMQGATTLQLAEAVPATWRATDEVLIPDTRHLRDFERRTNFAGGHWETATIGAAGVTASGTDVALAAGLMYDHAGARDAAGEVEVDAVTGFPRFLPHVARLTRNVVFASANPAGARAHFAAVGAADIDVRYARFDSMGRTTNDPLDSTTPDGSGGFNIGTNQIARYAFHMHHLYGPPASSPPRERQYNVIGNVVHDATKWGIVVHATHFGRVAHNIVYIARGAGVITEDGSETGNIIEDNFVAVVYGTGDRVPDAGGNGREGSGFWLRGPMNHIRRNVASAVICSGPWGFGYSYALERLGDVTAPQNAGDTPSSYVSVDPHSQVVPEFDNNEVYGAVSGGLTVWWVGTFGDSPRATSDSMFRRFTAWHVFTVNLYHYPASRCVYTDWVIRGDATVLSNRFENPLGLHFGDYMVNALSFFNADVQGVRIGIDLPQFTGPRSSNAPDRFNTDLQVVGGYFANWYNVGHNTPFSVNGATNLPPQLAVISGTRFGRVTATTCSQCGAQCDGCSRANVRDGSNVVTPDELVFMDYPGTAGPKILYYPEQEASFLLPDDGSAPGGGRPIVSCPTLGLTNAQCWSTHTMAWAGAVASCATTHPNMTGFWCDYATAGSITLRPLPTPPTPAPNYGLCTDCAQAPTTGTTAMGGSGSSGASSSGNTTDASAVPGVSAACPSTKATALACTLATAAAPLLLAV